MRKNLVKRRKELGLTQEGLAKKIDKSRSTVSCYETGKILPPYDVVKKIKKILKFQGDSLFSVEEEDKNEENSS